MAEVDARPRSPARPRHRPLLPLPLPPRRHTPCDGGRVGIHRHRRSGDDVPPLLPRNPSMDEYKNIKNHMDTIIHESCEYGHISEHVYDRLNIVRDRDSLGREVMRDATITQESY